MKLIKQIPALAIIGLSLTNQSSFGSEYIDLAANKEIVVNDEIPQLIITIGENEVVTLSNPQSAMPYPERYKGFFKIQELKDGVRDARATNKKAYASWYKKFKINNEKTSREKYTSFEIVASEFMNSGKLPGQNNFITDYMTGQKKRANEYVTYAPVTGSTAVDAAKKLIKLRDKEIAADEALYHRMNESNRGECPPGKRRYRKTALFGLIKGKILCLSDYEAESLQAQQLQYLQNMQNNLKMQETQNYRPKFVNCSSNTYGNYVSTSCYAQ